MTIPRVWAQQNPYKPEQMCERFMDPDLKTRDSLKKLGFLPADGFRHLDSYAMHELTHTKAGGNAQVLMLLYCSA